MAEKIHTRDPHRSNVGVYLAGGALAVVLALVGMIGISVRLGSSWAGLEQIVSANPIDAGLNVMSGKLIWPTQASIIAGTFAVLALALIGVGTWWWASRSSKRRSKTPVGLATVKDLRIAKLDEASARKEGRFLRPSLANVSDKDIETAELALRLGFLRNSKHPVWVSTKDAIYVEGAAQQGKSSRLAVPMVLSAPGGCLTTSTKVDILHQTWLPRYLLGEVVVFDPENISGWPDRITWSVIAGCEDADVAIRRATALVAAKPKTAKSSGDGDFFDQKAATLLRCYLHAAALGHRRLSDVTAWCESTDAVEAREILDEHHAEWARTLSEILDAKSEKTTSSILMVLTSVMEPLASPSLLAAVDCPAASSFDVRDFVEKGTGTMYVLSEGGNGSVAPFAAALAAEVFFVANKLSQRRAGRKLDPALRMVLDELNNVAPIPELPAKMSDSGGRGIQLVAFTHNFSQTERRWGREGAKELAGSANIRLILPGLLDTATLKEVSTLLGSIEEFVLSAPTSGGRGMGTSRGGSLHRRQVMEESAIRELEEGTALMIRRNNKAVMLDLPGFWEDPQIRDVVAASEKQAAAVIEQGFVSTSPPVEASPLN
ncbi:type IV secretory system conjugative DNA transfer family protein [Rhodococcus qingshengii]|uniref:type IV secretory system conjugative DNA transfer family protein n=1 Tax=Rhodococcus qingshengii TaxID=334542 RepID=UPI001ADF630B|nr:TraM recognition domain-containing protein [Rhodococcus qingshengii]